MTKKQTLNLIQSLANSQGFYGRLLEYIKTDAEYARLFFKEARRFKDELDFILFLEQ